MKMFSNFHDTVIFFVICIPAFIDNLLDLFIGILDLRIFFLIEINTRIFRIAYHFDISSFFDKHLFNLAMLQIHVTSTFKVISERSKGNWIKS